MKRIVYLGNKLEAHGATPSTIDTLTPLLWKIGFKVKAVSSKKNKFARLSEMIAAILRTKTYDVVLIDTYSTRNFYYALIAAKICNYLDKPFILYLHGGNLQQRLASISVGNLGVLQKAEHVLAPSVYLKEKLDPYFSTIQVIPNSIHLEQYKFQKRLKIEPKIIWVRALAEIYDPFKVLRVGELLHKTYSDYEILMVGPDKEGLKDRLQQEIDKKHLNIKLAGRLSKEEWIATAENYDIFLNTSKVDNTPVSVIEAMALGLPIVSSRAGGIPYLLEHGETALLVLDTDESDYAINIERMIKYPEMALNLAENARKEAESYDWEQVKHKWLELLA